MNSPVCTLKRSETPDSVKISEKVCDMKNSLVMNVEQVLLPHCALLRGRLCSSIPVDIVHNKPGSDVKKSSNKSKFATWELYSTLCTANKIQNIARGDTKWPSDIIIHPSAKQMLDVKLLVFLQWFLNADVRNVFKLALIHSNQLHLESLSALEMATTPSSLSYLFLPRRDGRWLVITGSIVVFTNCLR
jgi:hypothetical protein